MKLDEIVAWYQKKIGTYDKQQWEKTVEQKIIDGFSSVTLKTAKLKTELIDVDLVRGSTFPKAKPKQTLLTVIRLAILRYIFLPVYAQWWVKQTSPNTFTLLLLLYITQMMNWAVYALNTNRLEQNNNAANNATTNNNNISFIAANVKAEHVNTIEEEHVSLTELLIPMALSLLLSLIHSQIVATNTAGVAKKAQRRRYSNTSLNGKQPKEARVRRRKKLVKNRSNAADVTENSKQMRKKLTGSASLELLNKATQQQNVPLTTTLGKEATLIADSSNLQAPKTLTLDLNLNTEKTSASGLEDCKYNKSKRNVNWHSPIHHYAVETQEKQQQTTPQANSTTTTSSESSTPNKQQTEIVDSSSANDSAADAANKTIKINNKPQEFVVHDDDDNVQQQQANTSSNNIENVPHVLEAPSSHNSRRNIGEDDGFESLNGKSSSGDDTILTAMPTTSHQLRLRLNADKQQRKDMDSKPTTAATSSYRCQVPASSESEYEKKKQTSAAISCDAYQQTKKTHLRAAAADVSTEELDTDQEDDDDVENISSPTSHSNTSNYTECTTSATEWLGVTTNSEDCSYSSEMENSDALRNHQLSDEEGYDMDFLPNTILNAHGVSDRISCTIWAQREIKKAQMSVLEISSCIIERVESMPETNDYIYIGIGFSFLLSLIPTFCRLYEITLSDDKSNDYNYFDVPMLLWEKASFSFFTIFRFAFGATKWERTILIIGLLQRLCLTLILFTIFSVAERTFKQRFLYAKLFSHLTSSRRARKSNLPHFRLNKVRNIKTWLSVRSYLKKRGPQRSVDVIVSAAFIVTLLLLSFLSVEWLKDSVHLHSHLNLEALMWSSTIGIFLIRFMTLGNKIHEKYRSISVLITEQINLYLQIEQKPKKKDELMVSNSVLKLAADLLKELESPFKISGLSANPYLFTTVKVVILSALSGVLSEMLGFKLKLHKIKIK